MGKPKEYELLSPSDAELEGGDDNDTPPELRAPRWAETIPKASWWDILTFNWMTPLIKLGKRRQLDLGDIPPLSVGLIHWQSLDLPPLIGRYRARQDANPDAPIIRPLIECFWKDIVCAWLLAVTEQACNLGSPLLLRQFLASFNVEDPTAGAEMGLKYAAAMVGLSLLQTFAGNHGFLVITTLGVKQRGVIMALLYLTNSTLLYCLTPEGHGRSALSHTN